MNDLLLPLLNVAVGFAIGVSVTVLWPTKKNKKDRLEVWQSPPNPLGREWYWHRKALNNEIISNGEGYETKQGALKGAFRANPDLKKLYLKVTDNIEGTNHFDEVKRRKVV